MTLGRALTVIERFQVALQMLYDETADYITVNHLGDVHHNLAMKRARDVLKDYGGKVYKPAKKTKPRKHSMKRILT